MRTKVAWIAVAVIVLLGGTLRFGHHAMPFEFPDESITFEVVRHMRQTGDWDVNWRKAELSPELKYDQYNFSSHLYATYFFYRLVKLVPGTLAWRSERDGFVVYRFLSAALGSLVVLQAIQLGFVTAARTGAIIAGTLTAISTLLVQDAHYVRPEPFMTVLTLAAVALSLPRGDGAFGRAVLAGVCMGLLIACKISLVMLAWVPFVPLVPAWRESRTWRASLLVVIAIALGFLFGAPGALTNPEGFAHGVRKLSEQYGGLHPPHSHADGSATSDLLAGYFIATFGWPLIAGFALGVFALLRERAWGRLVVLVGPVFVFFGGFATRSVFFERNLSPVVPLVFVVAAAGVTALARVGSTRVRPAYAVAGVLLVILALRPVSLTYRLFVGEYMGRRWQAQEQYEISLRAAHPNAKWHTSVLLGDELPQVLTDHFKAGGPEVLLRATDYRDDWCKANRRRFEETVRAEVLAIRPGSFPEVPTGTLLTYHSTTDWYYLVHGLR
jgi:4-amino-4-deoxy-L-arabinose transferase-like glycosyltransferase